MKILGYDPGTVNQGFSLLKIVPAKKEVELAYQWTLELKSRNMKDRLTVTHNFVSNVVTSHPDIVAFLSERIVVTGNGRDNQNRIMGVILLALPNVTTKFYVPSEVKKAVSGYHKASKDAIAFAVCKMLNLEQDYKFSSNHASDAAAIGLTYLINELDYPHGSTEPDSN